MDIGLELNGNVNGHSFQVTGVISGEQGGGGGVADVKAIDALPKGFDIALLPYCLMTGQPSLSASTEGTVNPFITTKGAYVATRTLDLGVHGFLSTKYRVEWTDKGLTTFLKITGNTNVPRLKRILPAIETWSPLGGGKIAGHFTMVWETEDGEFIKGEADTHYELALEKTIPSVQYRYIQIDITRGDDWIKQDEKIVLYTPSVLLESLQSK